MHVAVCNPNDETCDLLSRLFKAYQDQRGCTISSRFFKNTIDLLCDFMGGEYDVIFFSNPRQGRLAQEIREKDRRVRLVHLTGLDSVTPDDSNIWYGLPEPPSSAFLFPLFDRLCLDTRQEDEAGLLVKSKGSVMQLPFFRIEYVEVIGRSVLFHLVDGSMEEVPGAFSEFESRLLCRPDFVKIHRAYIVNLRYVQKLEINGILTTNGHSVPVSKHLYPQFKRDYLCHQMDPATKIETISPPPAKPCSADTYSILLVDDEEEQQMRWAGALIAHGCIVQTASNGETAMMLASQGHFDCVVLDVKLGTERGFDLCDALTKQTGAPVIFLSSLDDTASQTQGFLSGGIDYITKDATNELFWLKIETRVKMAKAARAELIDGCLHLDLKGRRSLIDGQEVPLTSVEFDILSLLMRNPGVVYTPTRLYEGIWGSKQPDSGQAIQLHLSLLGRKLEVACPHHRFIETVWGKGYRFLSMSGKQGNVNEKL